MSGIFSYFQRGFTREVNSLLLSLLSDSAVLRNFDYLIPHSLFPPDFEGILEEWPFNLHITV